MWVVRILLSQLVNKIEMTPVGRKCQEAKNKVTGQWLKLEISLLLVRPSGKLCDGQKERD